MSPPQCPGRKHIFLALCLISLRTAASSATCHTPNGDFCPEAVSEADVSAVDDVHALEVSLMQKEMARMQRHAHTSKFTKTRIQDGGRFPFDYIQCAGQLTKRTIHMTGADYDAVVARMQQIYDSQSSSCDREQCDQSHWAGCILRLAAHDFMDYTGTGDSQLGIGGANGCIDLSDPDNAGLSHCFIGGPGVVGLAQVYEDFCTKISLADFLVIAAEGVMNITRENVLKVDPQRQALDFRSRFKYGRLTQEDCSTSLGLMPDAERGCAAVDDTLITNLGLNWTQSAALLGGHTLGGTLTSNSGYKGRWKESAASRLFDNGYYTSLVLKGWAPEVSVAGNVGKNQWRRVDVGVDERNKGYEVMLDSDMCLYYSFHLHHSDYRDFHASTAHNQGCDCAWARPAFYSNAIMKYTQGEACGSTTIFDRGDPTSGTTGEKDKGTPHSGILNLTQQANIGSAKQRMLCCGMSAGSGTGKPLVVDMSLDCGEAGEPKGPAADAVMLFANDEDAWIAAYYEAWGIATAKGWERSLSPIIL